MDWLRLARPYLLVTVGLFAGPQYLWRFGGLLLNCPERTEAVIRGRECGYPRGARQQTQLLPFPGPIGSQQNQFSMTPWQPVVVRRYFSFHDMHDSSEWTVRPRAGRDPSRNVALVKQTVLT